MTETAKLLEGEAPSEVHIEGKVPTEPLAVNLSEIHAGRVRGGAPSLEFADVKLTANDHPAGAVLRLVAGENHAIAFGICDPDNDCIRIWPFAAEESPEKLDLAFVRRRI